MFNNHLVINVPLPSSSCSIHDKHISIIKTHFQAMLSDPTVLTIFTDGLQLQPAGKHHCCMGAGYVAYVGGKEVQSGSWGLRQQAGIYDAEMIALTGSTAAAVDIQSHCPELKSILFLSDNQLALNTISDTTEHPVQGVSILFCHHIDKLLASPDICVELIWVLGHKGIIGNK
jgi:hypothetical protein